MNPDDILNLVRRRPFQPFLLHLTDGSAYEIRHPEMLMPGRRVAVVGIPNDPGQPVADRNDFVSWLHIVRIEMLGTGSAQPANGA